MKAVEIANRHKLIMSYINSFVDSKCRQPSHRIAYLLELKTTTVKRDITSLIKKGMITTTETKRGYRKHRVLIGNPNIDGSFRHPEVKFEDIVVNGYTYKIPVVLPRHTAKLIVVSHDRRPRSNGRALDIDWEYWDARGVVDTPTAQPIDTHFPPFDTDNYIIQEY